MTSGDATGKMSQMKRSKCNFSKNLAVIFHRVGQYSVRTCMFVSWQADGQAALGQYAGGAAGAAGGKSLFVADHKY